MAKAITVVPVFTVRSHMQNQLFKLGVRSQLAAALFAIEHGVVGHYGCCLQPWRPAAS